MTVTKRQRGKAINSPIQKAKETDQLAKLIAEKFASGGIVPTYMPMRTSSIEEWQGAVNMAQNPYTLSRWQLYKSYDAATLDLHLTSLIEDRELNLKGTKFKLLDANGDEDEGVLKVFKSQWYTDYITYAFQSTLYGYSLIELFELVDFPITVETNSGKKTFKPLKVVTLIPRDHVRPEEGKWLKLCVDPIGTGTSYTEYPASTFYIGVGKKTDLGLLKKITPVALAKRYAAAAWSEYDDKLGIPFRWVTMQGTNNKREKLLADILNKMGSAGWAVLHEGEKIELLKDAGNDPHKCFLELINLCDKQMSKAVVGGTMTKDAEGGQYKGDIHQESANLRYEADRTFIEYLNNTELIPRLVKLGYPLEGYTYEVNNKQELPINEQIKIDDIILKYYSLGKDYIAKKYDIPIDQIEHKTDAEITKIIQDKKQPTPKSVFHSAL